MCLSLIKFKAFNCLVHIVIIFFAGPTIGVPCFSDSRADKDDSRCFNCGSYSHALKDCPKPRDNVAISNARKQHNLKRNQSNVNRVQNRYYQKTPGKFDDLKAGVLGPETRECLGIGVMTISITVTILILLIKCLCLPFYQPDQSCPKKIINWSVFFWYVCCEIKWHLSAPPVNLLKYYTYLHSWNEKN